MVVKPDVGCNGNGVRLVDNPAALEAAVAAFAPGVCLLLQRFVPEPGEAGLFYIRHPNEAVAPDHLGDAEAPALHCRRRPLHVGGADPCRSARRPGRPSLCGTAGEPPGRDSACGGGRPPWFFTGNHCKGAIFRNGADRITPALTRQVDEIARDIPRLLFRAHRRALRLGGSFAAGSGFHRHRVERRRLGGDAYLGCSLHPSRRLRRAIRPLPGGLGDWAGESGERAPSERVAHHVSGLAAPNAADGVLPNQ